MDLNLDRAAKRAKTTNKVILTWIQDGRLPAIWTQTGWHMRPADVDAACRRASRQHARAT
jgi:predicted site-specific integrase-resolvase